MRPPHSRTLDLTARRRRPPRFLPICVLGLASIAPPSGEASGQAIKAAAPLKGRIFLSLNNGAEPFRGIIAIDPNEGTWTRIIDRRSNVARVSPDGRRLAFTRLPPDVKTEETWVLDLDGEDEPVRILEHAGRVCWSPDSKQVVVSGSAIPRTPDRIEMATWRVKADGSDPERLPIPETELICDWSPDGRWFLSLSARHFPADADRMFPPFSRWSPVYAMRTDGTDERIVIPREEPTETPRGKREVQTQRFRFSPDSRTILYGRSVFIKEGRRREFEEYGLWLVGLDGKDPRQIMEGTEKSIPGEACWSPDGRSLAIIRHEERDDGTREYRVEIARPDGQAIRPIPLPALPIPYLLDWR